MSVTPVTDMSRGPNDHQPQSLEHGADRAAACNRGVESSERHAVCSLPDRCANFRAAPGPILSESY